MISHKLFFLEVFSYSCEIKVSHKNFVERTKIFEEELMKLGKKYELFYFKEKELHEEYLQKKESRLNESITLFDLWKNLNNEMSKLYIKFPLSTNNYTEKSLSTKEFSHILEIHSNEVTYYPEIEGNSASKTISTTISSNSNIWWQHIDISIDKNKNILNFSPPINNSHIAYRIVPKFNSFLRDLRNIVEHLEGKLVLDAGDNRFATKKGILLDNKIIYQEDIDEGGVELPTIKPN